MHKSSSLLHRIGTFCDEDPARSKASQSYSIGVLCLLLDIQKYRAIMVDLTIGVGLPVIAMILGELSSITICTKLNL